MTHELSRAWGQPELIEILIDDDFATMNKNSFDKLGDYSRSQPSAVYEGKMWKSSDDKITWHLHWWGFSDDPDKCSGNVREIKIIEGEVIQPKKALPESIQYLADAIEKKGLKMSFGLEQQGHISTIEKIIDDLGCNEYAWEKIGKEIGWCPNTASHHYIKYLREKINSNKFVS